MPGRIPPEFVDRILSRIDLVELVNARVPLRKAGKNYQARCPFHTEKTPSFTVSPDKQLYYCFGCGAHGSAIGFLMDYAHLSFLEAVEDLAAQAGLPLPQTAAPAAVDQTDDYAILEQASAWFRQQLRLPIAQAALTYLKGRGVSGEIAAEFGLGYAPAGWDQLRCAVGTTTAQQGLLARNGLLSEKAGRFYDRFRERIMFPIRDQRGRVIGFGGRVLGDATPKYLNSPDTPLFHKSHQLYGLYEVRRALRHIEQLLIVEGYLDVITLAQAGIRYAVATLGTATTSRHLEQVFRLCNRLIFCFDGDRAGVEAAWKALLLALPFAQAGREISFLTLPPGDDPDSWVRREGVAAFEARLNQALPLSDFLFTRLSNGQRLDSMEQRAHLAERIKPLLEKLPEGLYRQMLTARLTELVALPIADLNLSPAPAPTARAQVRRQDSESRRMTPVRWAIALLLQYPHLGAQAATLPAAWRQLLEPGITVLATLLELTCTQTTLNTGALIERWRDTTYFAALSTLAHFDLSGANAEPEAELRGAFQRLNQLAREQEMEHLYRKSQLTPEEKVRLRYLTSRTAADVKLD